ncbi:MAG: aromatic amino acid lyase, partial [Streptosporangiaceae bacterium]|nr:aromatic amino acid lyase [Streptosporangiaceae bacterium]
PVSYELASSVKGEGIEDRATMAPLSARRLADMIQLCTRVVAIELVVAAQAADLRGLAAPNGPAGPGLGPDFGTGTALGRGTARAYRLTRELVPFTDADATLPADLEPLVELINRGDLSRADD